MTYYQRNREAALDLMRRRYVDGKAYLDAIKLERGCVDCGYRANAAALQFDHIDPNTKEGRGVSYMKNYKRSRLDAEVAKCEVRCANCHAVRSETEEHWKKRLHGESFPISTHPTLFESEG